MSINRFLTLIHNYHVWNISLKAYLKISFRANEKAQFYIRYRVEKERMEQNETNKEGRKEGITYIASWFKEYRWVTII